jgi:hypothetical protein
MIWLAALLGIALQSEPPPADDFEFLRRISLDLIGRVPLPAEIRRFTADADPGKRRRKIDEMLASPEFASFWSSRLADGWMGPLPVSDAGSQARTFRSWLRERIEKSDARIGDIVRDLLTASDSVHPRASAFVARFIEYTPRGTELRIDALTGDVAYAFLGVRLRCAQCHDHPVDRWTQEDFWGMAGFFAKTDAQRQGGVRDEKEPQRYALEGQTGKLSPRYLDGTTPESGAWRTELAKRITADPLFSRAFVNRVWAWLLGEGLREPVDRMTESGTSSTPELLDALAAQFSGQGTDLRFLVRTICSSQAYQRRRARLRPMTPEQHFESVSVATDLPKAAAEMSDDLILSVLGGGNGTGEHKKYRIFRRWFLSAAPGGIRQVLHTLNRDFPLFAGTRAAGPGRLHDLLRSEPDSRVVEELYLGTVSRFPSEPERARALDHVARKGSREAAFEELFWALLNSDEFLLNH